MKQDHWERLDLYARAAMPGAVGVILAIMSVVPFGVPYLGLIKPAFIMIVVFYWVLYQPSVMPGWLTFLIGLLYDLISNGPPGMMALVLLLIHLICSNQRRVVAGQSFVVVWLAFMLVAGGGFMSIWVLACLFYFHLQDPFPVVGQFLITVLLYPPVVWLFGLLRGWIKEMDAP